MKIEKEVQSVVLRTFSFHLKEKLMQKQCGLRCTISIGKFHAFNIKLYWAPAPLEGCHSTILSQLLLWEASQAQGHTCPWPLAHRLSCFTRKTHRVLSHTFPLGKISVALMFVVCITHSTCKTKNHDFAMFSNCVSPPFTSAPLHRSASKDTGGSLLLKRVLSPDQP